MPPLLISNFIRSCLCIGCLAGGMLLLAGCGSGDLTDPVAERRKALLEGPPDEFVLTYDSANESLTLALDALKAPYRLGPDGKLMHVELSGILATDRALSLFADQVQLKLLDLQATQVTDDGLKHLAKMTELEYLNLGKTAVTDKGLSYLKPLKKLKTLYVYDTAITASAANSLKSSIPGLNVVTEAPRK